MRISTIDNCRVVLRRPLAGVPQPDDFELVTASLPAPEPGQVLVRHLYLSLDPYQRPAMAGRHAGSAGPMGAGDMPPGETIGQVVESRDRAFQPGDFVRHFGGWQAASVADAAALHPVDPRVAPLSAWLGVLGMPGLTAWASVVKLADVQPGQTVLVSAAAGPVGATVGQIACQLGAEAVGIAGSDAKCQYVRDQFGFRDCVNYKSSDWPAPLAAALPDGADVYHDNVGGQMLADALGVLKNYGTVILCGLMSGYNDPAAAPGLYLGLPILRRAVMKGLVVYDFEDQRDQFVAQVAPWVAAGRVRYLEDRADGLGTAPAHFCRLMRGENFGKSLVVLAPESA
jgi:NADPH-dependent curcumin reductase CurA